MKILHVSAARNWGGGEHHVKNLCFELKEKVTNVVFCVAGGILHEKLERINVEVVTAPMANQMDLRFFLKLARICRKEQFDLIHIHDSTALALAVFADKFADLPPFIFSKKTSFPIRQRRRTLFKYNYPKIKKILCVSEATKQVSLETLKNDNRLQVIYHGTRIGNKSKKPLFWIKKKYDIPKEAVLIGNIGNHIEAKNLGTFIHTAHYLVNLKQQSNFCFVQIGNFSKRTKALKEMVKEYGLEQHVFFTGYIPEAASLIPQFDISLITSEMEGIPQVIYESFYHNVPVVSTNVGGIPEVIENNVNGLLNDPYDHKGLGENLLFLIENPQVIANFAKISRKKLLQNFTSQIMAEKTLLEYKKAINGRLHGRIK